MKKVLAGLACVAIFIFSGVAHAYTVKVVNCSDRNIIVTVAASYLVTAQDHLTIAVDPHKINTGSMGGLLSAGYRVAVDRSCPTQYNRSNFTHGCGFAGSFVIRVQQDYANGCVKVLDSWCKSDFSEDCDGYGYIK